MKGGDYYMKGKTTAKKPAPKNFPPQFKGKKGTPKKGY